MMQKKYEYVAELFTFDVNKYSQEEFFRDINEFIASYKVRRAGACCFYYFFYL